MSTVTDLIQSVPTLIQSDALGINNAGQVVGEWDTQAFLWTPNASGHGTFKMLGSLIPPAAGVPPASSSAGAINDNGDIVGSSEFRDSNGTLVTRACLWRNAQIRELGTLIHDPNVTGAFLGNSRAAAINNQGWIVGVSDSPTGFERAFLWPDPSFLPSVRMLDLGTLIPDPSHLGRWLGASQANGINDDGTIVGFADANDASGNAVMRAFRWRVQDQTPRDLSTFIPDPLHIGSALGNSAANAISVNGTIVGFADNALLPGGSNVWAFRRSAFFGALHPLPPPPLPTLPPKRLVARALNIDQPDARIVGFWDNGDGTPSKGFLAIPNQIALTDLSADVASSGWDVEIATGINVNRWICGTGTNALFGTTKRAILITP
jgi:probable HAF family extracellular repeat protein